LEQPYVIVWDLDGTLGEFAEVERLAHSVDPVRLWLRPGLEAALKGLSTAGFRHTVLTVATLPYARLVLHGTGLAGYFDCIEGRDQRPKGDAAGIAAELGIAEAQRPHRMLFIGDRMVFDEPADPGVIFHLELHSLTRPADEFARLVVGLRELGGGSLRQGFDRLGGAAKGWRRFLPRASSMPVNHPVQLTLADLPPLLLLARLRECSVVGFEQPPPPGQAMDERTIVPAEVARQLSRG
jgi:hypothetical protein